MTTPDRALETLTLHEDAFRRLGQEQALNRIVALVVQPGVEFDHSNIIHYRPAAAQALSRFIASTPWVFEAHSTDYQTPQALAQLVQDHFAILKVGPALTFALREAIFSLALMEKALVPAERQSRILEVIDSVMLDEPKYWEQYYHPRHSQTMVDLHYSLSDRIRHYWPQDRIAAALRQLISQPSAAWHAKSIFSATISAGIGGGVPSGSAQSDYGQDPGCAAGLRLWLPATGGGGAAYLCAVALSLDAKARLAAGGVTFPPGRRGPYERAPGKLLKERGPTRQHYAHHR